jgi:hypothetical protein
MSPSLEYWVSVPIKAKVDKNSRIGTSIEGTVMAEVLSSQKQRDKYDRIEEGWLLRE